MMIEDVESLFEQASNMRDRSRYLMSSLVYNILRKRHKACTCVPSLVAFRLTTACADPARAIAKCKLIYHLGDRNHQEYLLRKVSCGHQDLHRSRKTAYGRTILFYATWITLFLLFCFEQGYEMSLQSSISSSRRSPVSPSYDKNIRTFKGKILPSNMLFHSTT